MRSKSAKVFFVLAVCVLINPSLQAAPVSLPPQVSPAALSPIRIGIVAVVRGTVQIVSKGQVGKVAGSGQPVFLGDTISTDEKGSLQILLLDQTVFTIGPNSAIVIDKFVYDPATDDGVVKAKVVKGIFRFVTGKIGQKKPQQMEVELPAGTIGIRGTIVAGEVLGKKSTVVLLGPGEKNNTGHRQGRFTLSNGPAGQIHEEIVSKTGFGSTIEGEGAVPTKPFQIPAEQMLHLTTALGPISPAPPEGAPPGKRGKDAEGGGEVGRGQSPTEQAGQGKVVARDSVRQTGSVGTLVQRLGQESAQASQRIVDNLGTVILDGPTSRNQLQIAAQKLGGVYHFEKTGTVLSGSLGGAGSAANFYVDINFSNRSIGGGDSRVDGNVQAGQTFRFDLGSRPFGVGDDNAAFNFPAVVKSSGTCSSCVVANIDIGVNNRGGLIADNAQVSIVIKDGSAVPQANASVIAPRVEGSSPP